MDYLHKNLAEGGWQKLSLVEQLANVGSEARRALKWKECGEKKIAENCFWRALELVDLTIADKRWAGRLKEILRLREVLCDYFFDAGNYRISSDELNRYFLPFALNARQFA